MKKIIYTLLLACLVLSGCSSSDLYTKTPELSEPSALLPADTATNIIVATDFHYIASTLSNDSEYLYNMMLTADGKMTIYIEEIIDAFILEVLEHRPSALFVPGDVSFNGAKESHLELASKLQPIKDAGIPVVMLTGNHDIEYKQSAKFEGNSYTMVDSVTTQEFIDIYKPLEGNHILNRHDASNSYVFALREDLWVIGIDTNLPTDPNYATSKTLLWLEEQLQFAKQNNIKVMTLTHQNILPHNPVFTSGFSIQNADKVLELLQQYDVTINFSGHMHAQHIAQKGDFYDIALSSLSVSPLQYAIVSIDENDFLDLSMHAVDVNAWAHHTNQTDPNLLDFKNYARNYFKYAFSSKVAGQLAQTGASLEEQKLMLNFANTLNHDYFSGILTEDHIAVVDTEAIALWEKYGKDLSFYRYLRSILTLQVGDFTKLSIQLN